MCRWMSITLLVACTLPAFAARPAAEDRYNHYFFLVAGGSFTSASPATVSRTLYLAGWEMSVVRGHEFGFYFDGALGTATDNTLGYYSWGVSLHPWGRSLPDPYIQVGLRVSESPLEVKTRDSVLGLALTFGANAWLGETIGLKAQLRKTFAANDAAWEIMGGVFFRIW